jgi:hypothetical protein
LSVDAVSERLRQRGAGFSEIQSERGRLDEVFRSITQSTGAGEARA